MEFLKKSSMLVLFALSVLLLSVSVSALPVEVREVRVDGTDLSPAAGSTNRLDLVRGSEFVVRIEMKATADVSNIEMTAFVSGYEYNDITPISDSVPIFDMEADVTYVKRLQLTLPDDVEEDDYKLRLIISDRNGGAIIEEYRLKLDVPRKQMSITDVVFNPENEVKAGRSLLTLVRIENTGEQDQDGVKVTVSIPELKVSSSDYIDEVESADEVTSEAIYMKLPSCAIPGTYNVDVVVTYDRNHRSVKKSVPLTVLEDDRCEGQGSNTGMPVVEDKTIITIGETQKQTNKGNAAVFPLMLTNAGDGAKTYTISVQGAESWSDVGMNPGNVLLVEAGQSKSVSVMLTPKQEAATGGHAFVITVNSGDDVLQQIAATLTVSASQNNANKSGISSNIKNGLEVGLVVVVVLLIILGIIIAFNKMKARQDEEEDDEVSAEFGQAYY